MNQLIGRGVGNGEMEKPEKATASGSSDFFFAFCWAMALVCRLGKLLAVSLDLCIALLGLLDKPFFWMMGFDSNLFGPSLPRGLDLAMAYKIRKLPQVVRWSRR